jgi:hypothetical protein
MKNVLVGDFVNKVSGIFKSCPSWFSGGRPGFAIAFERIRI